MLHMAVPKFYSYMFIEDISAKKFSGGRNAYRTSMWLLEVLLQSCYFSYRQIIACGRHFEKQLKIPFVAVGFFGTFFGD